VLNPHVTNATLPGATKGRPLHPHSGSVDNLLDASVYQLSLSPQTDINFNHSNPLKRYLINHDDLLLPEHRMSKDSSELRVRCVWTLLYQVIVHCRL
jgi:hypothetical protein